MNLKRELKGSNLQRYHNWKDEDESQKRIENFSIEEPETKKKKFDESQKRIERTLVNGTIEASGNNGDESQKRIERKLLLATPEFQLCSR